jgi:hypothetical protein
MRTVCALLMCLVTFGPLSALADQTLADFKGGIGVHPVSNVAGTQNADGSFPNVTRNIVRSVNPAGQVWVIADLTATVKTDGHISVDGRGLLLAGGNSIGTKDGVATVKATLICETAAPFTLRDSGLVTLDDNGDFRVDDILSPWPPSDCSSPVLLIRNAGGTWFAAGIPKHQ